MGFSQPSFPSQAARLKQFWRESELPFRGVLGKQDFFFFSLHWSNLFVRGFHSLHFPPMLHDTSPPILAHRTYPQGCFRETGLVIFFLGTGATFSYGVFRAFIPLPRCTSPTILARIGLTLGGVLGKRDFCYFFSWDWSNFFVRGFHSLHSPPTLRVSTNFGANWSYPRGCFGKTGRTD